MRPPEHVGSGELAVDGISVEGFEALYEAYAPRVRGLVRRLIADPDLGADVLQETFLRAFRAELHQEAGDDQWPWLATVARNLCLDALRKHSRLNERDELDENVLTVQLTETHGDPEWHFKALGRREGIADALASVSPRYRRMLLRKHLDGWCYEQIAQSEGMSVEAVKSALARARRTFRECYAAIAEDRGLAAALGGLLTGLRARFQSARHRLAERVSLSSPYLPSGAAFGDAFAAAVVAGAVAVSAGFGGGGGPAERPQTHVVARDVADVPLVRSSAPVADDVAGEGASAPEVPPSEVGPAPAQVAAPPAADDPSPGEAPVAPPVDLPPPDPNQRLSFDSDDHVPAEDPPARGILDLEVLHEDDGETRVDLDEQTDIDGEDGTGHSHTGVDCSQQQRDDSTTMTVLCGGLDHL